MIQKPIQVRTSAAAFRFGTIMIVVAISIAALGQARSQALAEKDAPDWEQSLYRQEALDAASRVVPEKEIRRADPEADARDAAAADAARQGGEWLDDEQYSEPPVYVHLRWPEGWVDGDTVRLRPAELGVTIDNRGLQPITAEVFITVDVADQRLGNHDLGRVEVRGRESYWLPLAPDALKVDFDEMIYSGQILVTAQGPGLPSSAISEPLFFHPAEDGQILVYGEDVLITRFGGGDFRGRHAYKDEPGSITTRVIHGGAGKVSHRRETAVDLQEEGDNE
jgi:hypothetical protein